MRKILPLLLIALVCLAGCAPAEKAGGYAQISAQEAIAMMEKEASYTILDVRTPAEYAERHITGAINVPNETIGSEAIAALPDKQQAIFVYCRSGNRSKQAAQKLAALGYTKIIEFGGINSWPGETTSEAM